MENFDKIEKHTHNNYFKENDKSIMNLSVKEEKKESFEIKDVDQPNKKYFDHRLLRIENFRERKI